MDSDLQVYNIENVEKYYKPKLVDRIELILNIYFEIGKFIKTIKPLIPNIKNQYIIEEELHTDLFNSAGISFLPAELYISYDKKICLKILDIVILDYTYWKYSKTASKYRNIFLNSTTDETKKDINKSKILLINLNK